MTSPVATPREGDEFQGPEPPPTSTSTGTYLDEFTAIYQALATPTRKRIGIPPGDADLLDLTVVAVLLGVGGLDGGDFDSASADLMRRRQAAIAAGEEFTWDEP